MMNQYEVAQILTEIGILIELGDPIPQKENEYRKAPHAVKAIKDSY
jgi:hypothetical protein